MVILSGVPAKNAGLRMAMEVESLDDGRLFVAKQHLPLLQANGLDSFARVMALPEGFLRRDFPGRRTSRLELQCPDGRRQTIYLKRYLPDYLSGLSRLLRRLAGKTIDEARDEWEAGMEIAALGIPTLDMIARGQDARDGHAVRSSFIMTAELSGAQEGHHYTRKLDRLERRRLLRRVAELTRRLHAAGWVHKDLYLGHYLVTPTPTPTQPEPSIVLIDLQRCVQPCCFTQRWRVKDLAALVYSSLKAGVTASDLAAAYQIYRDKRRLDGPSRRMARQVMDRVRWLKTRTPKHDSDFEQLK
jgi:heptose I phosphotransferase